jgi:hypothetical protein
MAFGQCRRFGRRWQACWRRGRYEDYQGAAEGGPSILEPINITLNIVEAPRQRTQQIVAGAGLGLAPVAQASPRLGLTCPQLM